MIRSVELLQLWSVTTSVDNYPGELHWYGLQKKYIVFGILCDTGSVTVPEETVIKESSV